MQLLVNFLWCVAVILPLKFFGQNLPSQNFTTSDGLANNAVRSLFLDSKNALWIGTENGVSLYEGGTFTNLYKQDGLSQNSCWGICEDTNNNMWFASYGGGVTKFDGKNFKVFTILNGLAHNKTRKVFSYKDKVIVATEFGVSIIDINTNTVSTPKEVFPHFGVFIVTDIFEYKNEIYFSALNEGFFKIINLTIDPKVIPVLEFQTCYSVGNFKNIFYSSNKGFIDVVDFKTRSATRVSKFGSSIAWQYAVDKRNKIYAACWGIFDNNGGLFEIVDNKMVDLNQKFGINSKKLLNVVYDKKNDFLYVGSKDNGIYKIQLDQSILYEPFGSKKVLGFVDNLILHQDGITVRSKHKIEKTISKIDFKNFQKSNSSKGEFDLRSKNRDNFELNYSLDFQKIEFYGLVKHKTDYYVSSNIGIFVIKSNGNLIKYIPIHTYNFGFTSDNLFFESHPYGATKIYENINYLQVKQLSKDVSDVVSSINVNDETFFLSVFNGLSSFKNGKFRSYLKEGLFLEEKLKHSAKSDKGELIISSEFGDVFIIEDVQTFKNIKKISSEKITGNSISFVECYQDHIIIGTEKGVNIYKDGIITLIDKEQGLLDCTFISSKIIDNELFLGTNSGYFRLNLDNITLAKENISKLLIKNILINNKDISNQDFKWFIYQNDELKTSHERNTISIDFIAAGSRYPTKLKYRYRLENDNQWSPYFDKGNVFLPYLPFGNYNLEIEVSDLSSGSSRVYQMLAITVLAPFYYRWWFVLLIILAFAFLSFLFNKRSKRKAKDSAIIEKRIAETKLEALLSQMNPHFIFNAMNAIQNYVISNDTLNSLHYIGEFAKLMRTTLENSSKPKIALREEIEYLKTYISIENMRFNHRVKIDFQISANVNLSSQIPTMLLQPFVENVFVHAFTTRTINPQLTVTFEMESSTTLQIKIIDNGKGIVSTSTKSHQSKGILLARERLSLHQNQLQESIEIQSNSPSGTKIYILLEV